MPSLRVPVKLARRYQVLTRYAYCRTSQCHWTDRGTGSEVEEQAEAHVVGDPDPGHVHLRLPDDSLACGAGHMPAAHVRESPCCRLNVAAVTCPACLEHPAEVS